MKVQISAEKVLIVGTNPLAMKIAKAIENFPERYLIVGFVDDSRNSGGVVPRNGVGKILAKFPFPIIGPLDRLKNSVADLRPDRIIVPRTDDGKLPIEDLMNSRIEGVWVEDGVEVYERLAQKLAIESIPPTFLIFCQEFNKPKFQMALHRALSLCLAGLALVLGAPLMLLIGLAIKLDSKGSVLYVQERVGRLGKIFRLLKFRTMRPAPKEEENGGVWERDTSSRVTRVGKWLRRFRLDELPQFINVLRGDMDVVGPRPEMACNVEEMTKEVPYYSLRHTVRPGITGWAQVKSGYAVSKEDVTEKVRYDLYYTKHMSLGFDLQILVETVKILLLGRGVQ